jgi:AraC family ethanolamine operon transcriptional activator
VLAVPTAEVESLLGLPPASRLFRPGSSAYRQTGACAWDRGVGLLRSVIATVRAVPDTVTLAEARRGLRDSVLEAARILLDGAAPQALPRTAHSAIRRQRLVVAADDYLRAHVGRPVYTEDLCRALATSPSALGEAFRATLAISPHRFLKLRRLSMVRAALSDREGLAPMVKAVALSHGFWHLSQFAKDYRALFGETPSDTLARARGQGSGNDVDEAPALALALAG